MMEKGNRKELLGLMITIFWTIALHAAVHPVAMGNISSDDQSILLEGKITGEFKSPMSIPVGLETDLHIKFEVLQGTVTFTGSTDVQILTIGDLSGPNVSSEHSIDLDQVGTYTITEQLKLSIKADNVLLSTFLGSLVQEEKFNCNWEYENKTVGKKTYTLSSSISDLDIQLSSEHLKAFPKDQDTITIKVEQMISAGTLVDYIIEYAAQWTKESSIADGADLQSNQPPILDPIPDSEVTIGQDLQIVLSATDPDAVGATSGRDNLAYSATGEPMNMGAQLDENVFTWHLMDSVQAGDYEVTFIVKDPAGASDEKTAKISVSSQEDGNSNHNGGPGNKSVGKGKEHKRSGKPDHKDNKPEGHGRGLEESGKPEDKGNKPDARVNLKLDDDSVMFRGGIPSFPVADLEAVFQLLKDLDLEGEFNGISYTLRVEIIDLHIEEDETTGTLILKAYLSSGDTEISEPGLECTFQLKRREHNFRLEIEGEGVLFQRLRIKVIGSVSDDGMVNAPVVHVDIKYGEEILELINTIPFEAIIGAFALSNFPEEIALPLGSFAGIEYSASLLLSDLKTKIVENKNKTQITADADVGISVMINGLQLEDLLKSRFELQLIKNRFNLELSGHGSILKVNLKINADVTDDGMVTSPRLKLELIYRQEGLPRDVAFSKGGEPEVETPETLEEIEEDVQEAAQEAAEATSEEAVQNAIKEAKKVAKEAEKASQKAQKAAQRARKEKLLQNYPNPFNPETWIPYELATDATVTIRIYNIKGRLVRQLDLGNQKAGSYIDKNKAAYWDGRNEVGEQVASGVYFYHIQAGSFGAAKKMLIAK